MALSSVDGSTLIWIVPEIWERPLAFDARRRGCKCRDLPQPSGNETDPAEDCSRRVRHTFYYPAGQLRVYPGLQVPALLIDHSEIVMVVYDIDQFSFCPKLFGDGI